MSEQHRDVQKAQALVQKAQALVAEWNQGKGTSKKDIEIREWNDSTSHGRRFDRFIQATLGVNTSPARMRPPSHVEQLEAQVRSLGGVPVGAPAWEHDLQAARQLLFDAVSAWNDHQSGRSQAQFAQSSVAAWTSYSLAYLKRRGDDWRQRDVRGRLVKSNGKDSPLTLPSLLEHAFPDRTLEGLKANVRFWSQHTDQTNGQLPSFERNHLAPLAYACLRNFERMIVIDFGNAFSVAGELVVPIELMPAPRATRANTEFTTFLDHHEFARFASDPTFSSPVTVHTPTLPSVMTSFSAAEVVAEVSSCIPFRFTTAAHNAATYALKVRANTRSGGDPRATDKRYCEWSSANKRHVYNDMWVARLVQELTDPERFHTLTGYVAQERKSPAEVVTFEDRKAAATPVDFQDLADMDIAY
jgi:hypothetical protein